MPSAPAGRRRIWQLNDAAAIDNGEFIVVDRQDRCSSERRRLVDLVALIGRRERATAGSAAFDSQIGEASAVAGRGGDSPCVDTECCPCVNLVLWAQWTLAALPTPLHWSGADWRGFDPVGLAVRLTCVFDITIGTFRWEFLVDGTEWPGFVPTACCPFVLLFSSDVDHLVYVTGCRPPVVPLLS